MSCTQQASATAPTKKNCVALSKMPAISPRSATRSIAPTHSNPYRKQGFGDTSEFWRQGHFEDYFGSVRKIDGLVQHQRAVDIARAQGARQFGLRRRRSCGNFTRRLRGLDDASFDWRSSIFDLRTAASVKRRVGQRIRVLIQFATHMFDREIL